MANVYKNFVTSERTTQKYIEKELKKRVKFDDIIAETINFNKIYGGSATLGGADNGDGELIIKDSSDVEKVKINNLGITLADDTSIIGGTGVLSTFQYNSYNFNWFANGYLDTTGDFWFLGYNTDTVSENWANFLLFDVYIPTGFTIKSATITLYHTPVNWNNGGDYDVWGYCHNIKAYTVTNYSAIDVVAAFASDLLLDTPFTFSEISGSFGTSGWTASVPSSGSHPGETTTSNDISSSLSAGYNKIAVKSADATPAFNADLATNGAALGIKTAYVYAVLNVTGYQS